MGSVIHDMTIVLTTRVIHDMTIVAGVIHDMRHVLSALF
jgi:hypothetical protein